MDNARIRQNLLGIADETDKQKFFENSRHKAPKMDPITLGSYDYLSQKFSSRFHSRIARFLEKLHFGKLLRQKKIILKEIRGRENLNSVANTGALVTCNQSDPFDSYAAYLSLKSILKRKPLYKLIDEEKMATTAGKQGYILRHAATLPIPSALSCLSDLVGAISALYESNNKILVFPEKGQIGDFKQPRALRPEIFRFAARENKPIIPIFITLEDSNIKDSDNLPVQEYTVHVCPPIFPEKELSVKANAIKMCEANEKLWADVYKNFYHTDIK